MKAFYVGLLGWIIQFYVSAQRGPYWQGCVIQLAVLCATEAVRWHGWPASQLWRQTHGEGSFLDPRRSVCTSRSGCTVALPAHHHAQSCVLPWRRSVSNPLCRHIIAVTSDNCYPSVLIYSGRWCFTPDKSITNYSCFSDNIRAVFFNSEVWKRYQ